MWRSVIMSSLMVALLSFGAGTDTSLAAVDDQSDQSFFVMFFVPGSADITPEARWIVEQAAASAKAQEASTLEIAISPESSREVDLFKARAAAIENVLSAQVAEPIRFVPRQLSIAENSIPGADSRAEIRIVQR
jgi:hypothetical protein